MSEKRRVLIQLLRDSRSKEQRQLLLSGPIDIVLAVCELALNFERGNLTAKANRTQRQYIEQLADRLVPVKRKRAFLVKRAGLRVLHLLLEAK